MCTPTSHGKVTPWPVRQVPIGLVRGYTVPKHIGAAVTSGANGNVLGRTPSSSESPGASSVQRCTGSVESTIVTDDGVRLRGRPVTGRKFTAGAPN